VIQVIIACPFNSDTASLELLSGSGLELEATAVKRRQLTHAAGCGGIQGAAA